MESSESLLLPHSANKTLYIRVDEWRTTVQELFYKRSCPRLHFAEQLRQDLSTQLLYIHHVTLQLLGELEGVYTWLLAIR